MQLTQEQIQSILEEAKPSIIAGLREEVTRQAKWEINPIVSKMIQDEVTSFMTAEIIPVIKQQLVEGKDGLIKTAIEAANSVATGLANAMAATLKEKLEKSYERTKILEALFK